MNPEPPCLPLWLRTIPELLACFKSETRVSRLNVELSKVAQTFEVALPLFHCFEEDVFEGVALKIQAADLQIVIARDLVEVSDFHFFVEDELHPLFAGDGGFTA